MCQHIFSKTILQKIDHVFNKNDFYKLIEYPFAATPLEIVWGLIPSWLGLEKWFFDGIYRPRKNLINFERIDDHPSKVVKYFNFFHKKQITITTYNNYIKIKYFNKNIGENIKYLGKIFFK